MSTLFVMSIIYSQTGEEEGYKSGTIWMSAHVSCQGVAENPRFVFYPDL